MNLLVKLFLTTILSLNVIACGGLSDQSSVDFSNSPEPEIIDEISLANANSIIPTGSNDLVAIKTFKIGQICNTTSYSQNVLNRIDLKNSGDNLVIQVFQNELNVLNDNYPAENIVAQLRNNSFLDDNGRLNRSLFLSATAKNITNSVCTIQASGLKQKLLSGSIDIKKLIQDQCNITEILNASSQADTANKRIIYDAIEELLNYSELKDLAISALLPYKLVISDPEILHSTYTSIDIGLFKGTDLKLNVVMEKALLQTAISNWKGFVAFMINSGDNKRCDYENIVSEQQ